MTLKSLAIVVVGGIALAVGLLHLYQGSFGAVSAGIMALVMGLGYLAFVTICAIAYLIALSRGKGKPE